MIKIEINVESKDKELSDKLYNVIRKLVEEILSNERIKITRKVAVEFNPNK